VEDAQLEGRLTSREEAMEFVRREFPDNEESGFDGLSRFSTLPAYVGSLTFSV